jgi:hypothetical protein
MKGLAEYAGVSVVALALWLLPRPLGWTPKQTGIALATSASLGVWVIMRSQAAIIESHEQELRDFKAYQEQVEVQTERAQLSAAAQAQQAQLSAQWQQFQQELEQAAAQKDAELSEVAQAKFEMLQQKHNELQQAQAALNQQIHEFEQQKQIAAQQPSLIEQAKAKVAEQQQMLKLGLELAKTQVEADAELEKFRASLGASKPQDAQAAALLQLMQGMEALSAKIDQPQAGLRAAYPTLDVNATPSGARARRPAAVPARFTEPEYDSAWADPPAQNDLYQEVVID